MERDVTKLVWAMVDSDDGMNLSLHCYYGRERKFCGEKYSGNSALCNKKRGVSEDGDTFIPIDKINSTALDESTACKTCLRIFKSITDTKTE